MPNTDSAHPILSQIRQHLDVIYTGQDNLALAKEILSVFDSAGDRGALGDIAKVPDEKTPVAFGEHAPSPWTQKDCLLITYGDSIIKENERPLVTLKRFLDRQFKDLISSVHILPFFPFSSDDGFAVIDFTEVRADLGEWSDIDAIADGFVLMLDLVINHVSSQSAWFEAYRRGDATYRDFFIEGKLDDDLTKVVRPRTSPLLRPTETCDGVKQVWCTFGHDQIDLNFASPRVLIAFMKVIKFYLAHRSKILRLDAIGYLWKEAGTSCIHLAQTHEIVRLIRTVCEYASPGTTVITETNVPNHENLSYFGNRNEAHAIYNFSLAPLLVHALLTGETQHLKRWIMSMPPAPDGCAYLNFSASHDGIGMRPAEGLLSDHEQSQLIETIRRHGGQFSTRQGPDGSERIYEINVSLFDALKGTVAGEDDFQIERFVCSQTIMLGIEGIPAFYIHSLLATPNDYSLVEESGRARSINRHRWDEEQLGKLLEDSSSPQSIVLAELKRRIAIRCKQPAFHPNATQFTLQFSSPIFGFWRQSNDRSQSIFAVHNMTAEPLPLRLADLNLIAGECWTDLLTGQELTNVASIDLAPYRCVWISNAENGFGKP